MDLRDKILFEPPEIGCVLSLTGLPGGGSKMYDRSAYGNHGTIIGASWKYQNGLWCLSFDGIDDKVDCGKHESLNLQGALTCEAWVNLKGTPKNYSCVLNKEDTANTYGWGLLVHSNRKVQFWVDDGDAQGVQDATTVLQDNIWYHIAGRYNGSAINVFVNGAKEGSDVSQGGPGTTATKELYVGTGWVANRQFNGLIALARVYNRALTALEIQNHFQREKHLFGAW